MSATLRLRVLEGALKHVPSLGWTTAALMAAVADAGLSVASVGMFPRGPVELVEHFITTCNSRLARDVQGAPFTEYEHGVFFSPTLSVFHVHRSFLFFPGLLWQVARRNKSSAYCHQTPIGNAGALYLIMASGMVFSTFHRLCSIDVSATEHSYLHRPWHLGHYPPIYLQRSKILAS